MHFDVAARTLNIVCSGFFPIILKSYFVFNILGCLDEVCVVTATPAVALLFSSCIRKVRSLFSITSLSGFVPIAK